MGGQIWRMVVACMQRHRVKDALQDSPLITLGPTLPSSVPPVCRSFSQTPVGAHVCAYTWGGGGQASRHPTSLEGGGPLEPSGWLWAVGARPPSPDFSPSSLETPATTTWFTKLDRSADSLQSTFFERTVIKALLLKCGLANQPSTSLLCSPDAQTSKGNEK